MARSGYASPSRFTMRMFSILAYPNSKCWVKFPFPSPRWIEIPEESRLPTTKSRFPSPLRSPAVMAFGCWIVGSTVLDENTSPNAMPPHSARKQRQALAIARRRRNELPSNEDRIELRTGFKECLRLSEKDHSLPVVECAGSEVIEVDTASDRPSKCIAAVPAHDVNARRGHWVSHRPEPPSGYSEDADRRFAMGWDTKVDRLAGL